jgi:hypothetical protein
MIKMIAHPKKEKKKKPAYKLLKIQITLSQDMVEKNSRS